MAPILRADGPWDLHCKDIVVTLVWATEIRDQFHGPKRSQMKSFIQTLIQVCTGYRFEKLLSTIHELTNGKLSIAVK